MVDPGQELAGADNAIVTSVAPNWITAVCARAIPLTLALTVTVSAVVSVIVPEVFPWPSVGLDGWVMVAFPVADKVTSAPEIRFP